MDYIQRQKDLHDTAGSIIKELDLVNFLSKYGRVDIVGSCALELMSWEDIDMVVNCDEQKPQYLFETIEYLFLKPNIYSLPWVQDFRKSIYLDRPQGLYLQARHLIKPETFWKIDIWFMKTKDERAQKDLQWIKKN